MLRGQGRGLWARIQRRDAMFGNRLSVSVGGEISEGEQWG